MGMAGMIAAGVLGGTTTRLTRTAACRALHAKTGAPRLPQRARDRSGLLMMLAWAAAAGVILALGDVLLEQRKQSMRSEAS